MLTNVESVLAIPGMANRATTPTPWLNELIGAADAAIKAWLKRDIECRAYVDFYTGTGTPDLTLRQYPVLNAQTTIAADSAGLQLPQSTIYVNSIAGFDPGTKGNPAATPPMIAIQTGTTSYTYVTYTGVQPNLANPNVNPAFTGCSGGTGTILANGVVGMPVVFYDPQGNWGQTSGGFGPSTQIFQGTQWAVYVDGGDSKSHRGSLRRIGSTAAGFVGYFPQSWYTGKLAGRRNACWEIGIGGNLKVCYSAGYTPYEVPLDIRNACAELVAKLVRIMPTGSDLSGESLGAYSYTVLDKSDDPDLGTMRRTLARHREVSIAGIS